MRACIACILVLAIAGPTAASARRYVTSISPAQEVPPTPSTATGTGTFTLNPNGTLEYTIVFSGLHGAETQAAVHGPAAPGNKAPILFALPLGTTKTGRLGPLSAEQTAELDSGLWYVCIHSSHHASGEVRGQILPSPTDVEPGSWGLVKSLFR